MEDARQLFEEMAERDVISWNAMIGGYLRGGQGDEAMNIFQHMRQQGAMPDWITLTTVVGICSGKLGIAEGKQVHACAIRLGLEGDVYVGNALIDMYSKLGCMENAYKVFDTMPQPSTVSFNAMIAGYARCNNIEFARRLFDKMPERDYISWTTMITGYAQLGFADNALQLFAQMRHASLKVDQFTFGSVLNACGSILSLDLGKQVHAYAIATAFESDVFVGSALVDMYGKCKSIEDARQVFDEMPKRNIVSWTAIIVGFAQSGHGEDALKHFIQMLRVGLKPDEFAVASVLSACASLAVLEEGRQVHLYIINTGLESRVPVGNSLITMYSKCGSIVDARCAFNNMMERDEVSWTAMIAGYGQHGCGMETLQLFEQMISAGMKPDQVTFIGVLSACSRAGLVDEGCRYFDSMREIHCIEPTVEHHACMIDLLGRAGHLDKVEKFIDEMQCELDVVGWATLLGVCRIHGNISLGKRAAKHLFELEPENPSAYVLLSNMCAAGERWNDVANVRKLMKSKGVKKEPGCSWIRFQNRVHSFVADDRSHPQTEKIYATLEKLAEQMKDEGYVPDTSSVLHNIDDDDKEHALCYHSERVAIAFALLNIPEGIPIRIVKNLRVCDDCHAATKFISKIVSREIIVRDSNRYHHFIDGLCSCRDYW
ncbi:putative pentatricopeptide repeat-containing protein At1g68930 isoform X2 [Cryptomeria japonica]|nr:putative pentatricopeptide repeat-containing protein At1g68930 isoform X2 [Cryptomeria japonica]